MLAGEVKRISILVVVPFFYGSIVASVFHPAYYTRDYVRSDKMPFVLRTITLDTLKPVSWRSLLDSGTHSGKAESASVQEMLTTTSARFSATIYLRSIAHA